MIPIRQPNFGLRHWLAGHDGVVEQEGLLNDPYNAEVKQRVVVGEHKSFVVVGELKQRESPERSVREIKTTNSIC